MAWRQQNSGVPAFRPNQTNRPVFEDFDPKIDTNENEGARIVSLHVPGFVKEQMKITFERGNDIRVQGQRALSNNKWSRFNQVIPVPTNCEANKIHAKYILGVLTITMPKTIVPPPSTAEKTTRQNISHNTPPTKPAETKATPPPPVSGPTQKSMEAVAQRATKGNEEQKAEKNPGRSPPSPQKRIAEPKERKASSEPKAEKGWEVTSPSQSHSEIKSADEMKKKPENIILDKPKESTDKGEESAQVATASKVVDIGKKVIGKLAPPKEKNQNEDGEAMNGNKLGIKYIAESAKQTMVGVVKRLNDDDRQRLINIGAAVMVLVALGAYISYGSFGSSSQNEN